MILRQTEERVDVILNPTNHERWTFPFFEDASLIGEQGVPMFLGNPRLAVLCAVNKMHQIFDEGLRHGNYAIGKRSVIERPIRRPEGAATCQPRATPWVNLELE